MSATRQQAVQTIEALKNHEALDLLRIAALFDLEMLSNDLVLDIFDNENVVNELAPTCVTILNRTVYFSDEVKAALQASDGTNIPENIVARVKKRIEKLFELLLQNVDAINEDIMKNRDILSSVKKIITHGDNGIKQEQIIKLTLALANAYERCNEFSHAKMLFRKVQEDLETNPLVATYSATLKALDQVDKKLEIERQRIEAGAKSKVTPTGDEEKSEASAKPIPQAESLSAKKALYWGGVAALTGAAGFLLWKNRDKLALPEFNYPILPTYKR